MENFKENFTKNALDKEQVANDELVAWVKDVHNPDADSSGYDLTNEDDRMRFIKDN
jgi:hypothetical protein